MTGFCCGFNSCPHFDYCNQNNCPLALNFKELKSFPEDKGHKTCKLTKRKRLEIGLKHNLSNLGLYSREDKNSNFCKAIIEEWKAKQRKPQEKEDRSNFIGQKEENLGPGAILEEGKGGKRA